MKSKNKIDKMFLIVVFISMLIFAAGSTFAYFSSTMYGKEGGVVAKSAVINISANVQAKYNEQKLIPMDDEDIYVAYQNNCIDIHNYGACHVYTIDLVNEGDKIVLDGSIKFLVNNISDNLKYMLFSGDKEIITEDDIIIDKTSIEVEKDLPLDTNIELLEGEKKSYTLFIWLTNIDKDQNFIDGNGTYNANISFLSTDGYKIAGTFSN